MDWLLFSPAPPKGYQSRFERDPGCGFAVLAGASVLLWSALPRSPRLPSSVEYTTKCQIGLPTGWSMPVQLSNILLGKGTYGRVVLAVPLACGIEGDQKHACKVYDSKPGDLAGARHSPSA